MKFYILPLRPDVDLDIYYVDVGVELQFLGADVYNYKHEVEAQNINKIEVT